MDSGHEGGTEEMAAPGWVGGGGGFPGGWRGYAFGQTMVSILWVYDRVSISVGAPALLALGNTVHSHGNRSGSEL